jgi:hypothetical protein
MTDKRIKKFHPRIARGLRSGGTKSTRTACSSKQGAIFFMKFTIEVVRTDEGGRGDVLHRVSVDEISPKRVKVKADQLLRVWRNRGGSSARVLNPLGEELYVSS